MQSRFWYLTYPGNASFLDRDDEAVGHEIDSLLPAERRHDLHLLLTSKRFTDIMWTWYDECLIRDHVLQRFQEEGFSGFKSRPVHARMKARSRQPDPCDEDPGVSGLVARLVSIPRLWEITPIGWGGMARPESGVSRICGALKDDRLHYARFTNPALLVDEAQCDGSDFFIVWPLPRYLFVTDRVAQFIRRHRLTGAKLQALESLEVTPSGTLTPGRLRQWLPEALARKYGEPLGIY